MEKITYTRKGDYYYPDLAMPSQPKPAYGKYGRMRERYLKEHKRILYIQLITNGRLIAHLNEIDETVTDFISRVVSDMAKAQGITEQLKAKDQMAWVGAMNAIKAQAEETAYREYIYD